ncbi:MAG: hypothetical protein KDC58_09280 [Cyclobacteriaceae bacterium]|nr:hypothetical protein [Cyclobacteriaceae bacterium]
MRRAVILLGILLVGFGSHAQKVKYKDLYVLLRARNYEDASGFLVSFLGEEPDHPNANYQMGLMLEYKLQELDLLKQTEAIIQRADSAVLYFNKSHSLIDDKEVKKHDDDYYELFKRRNLRSGKFEVILSDVQLDIEKRVESLNNLKKEVNGVKGRFDKATEFYHSCQQNYSDLKERYTDELTLALGATDNTLIILQNITTSYDSAIFNLKAYVSARKAFEAENYVDIVFVSNQIEDFSDTPKKEPDFYSRKIGLYNFATWSINQQSQVKSKAEFLSNLMKFDESLDKMSEDIVKDSVDLSSQIFGMITSPVLKELKLVDYDSWLMSFFQYKIGQLNLKSAWMGWYTAVADTLDVGAKLEYVKKIRSQYEGVVKLEKGLGEPDEALLTKRYHTFTDARLGGIEGVKNYITKQKGIVVEEENALNSLDSLLLERDKWAQWKQDSISVTPGKIDAYNYTIYSDSLTNPREVAIGGIHQGDSRQFFFGKVPSSRILDTLYFADVPKLLNSDQAESLHVEPLKLTNGQYLLTYTLAEDSGKKNAVLLLAGVEQGIAWVKEEKELESSAKVEEVDGKISIVQDGKDPIIYNLDGTKM